MDQDLTQKISRSAMRRKIRILTVVTTLSIFTAVMSILACVILFLHFKYSGTALATFEEQSEGFEKEEDSAGDVIVEAVSEAVYTQEEVDAMVSEAMNAAGLVDENAAVLDTLQNRLIEGDGTMNIFRDLYPNHVVMLDSGQYYFFEKDESLLKNTYNMNWFVANEQGQVEYVVGYEGDNPEGADLENAEDDMAELEDITYFDGETYKGIDVSKFQGEIDWKQVKEAGIDYAIIRVGVRGYSEGLIVEDEYFKQNIEGTLAADIPVGVYFFTAAINEEEALEEAQFVIDMLQGYEVAYPVYLDIEDVKSKNCRTNSLTKEQRTDLAEVFLNKVAEAGYTPGLYGNLKSYMIMLDLPRLEKYDKWLAAYTLPVYYPYEYKMLQYSEKGRVPGISGAVDLNISFKDYTKE